MPIGTLIRKIQCQLALSISQPPRIGPRIGPEEHRHAEDRHQAAHPLRAGRPGHDRHAERHQHAAAEALCDPERDEHVDGRRRGAEHRAGGEEPDRDEVQALGAEAVRCPTGHRDDRCKSKRVGRDRPRHVRVGDGVVDAAEHHLERRQRDVDHGDVQDRHDRAEDHHAGDLDDRCVDLLGVLRGLYGHGQAPWCSMTREFAAPAASARPRAEPVPGAGSESGRRS